MSRGVGDGGETAAPGGDRRKDRGEKERQPGPLPRCQQDETFHYSYISLQHQPTSRKEGRGEGFRGVWGGGEGFVTPAGIGVSVPPMGQIPPIFSAI